MMFKRLNVEGNAGNCPRFLFMLIGFLLITPALCAQHFFGKFLNEAPNGPIFIKEQIGQNYYTIDTLEVNNNRFNTQFSGYSTGYYLLWVSDSNQVDFIVNSTEKNIEFDFSAPSLSSLIILQSNENKLLYDYRRISRNARIEQKRLEDLLSLVPRADIKLQTEIQNQLQELQEARSKSVNHLYKQSGGTFFNTVMQNTLPVNGDSLYLVVHYFDQILFQEESLIRTAIFPSVLFTYFKSIIPFTVESFKSGVDVILEKASVNANVYQFCLDYMVELFTINGPPEILAYINERYLADLDCKKFYYSGTEKPVFRGQYYEGFLFKELPENLNLLDTFSNKFTLKGNLLFAGKQILLVFWQEDCANAISFLQEIYSLQNDNFIIVPVYGGSDFRKWKEGIATIGKSYPHCSNLLGAEHAINQSLNLHYWPFCVVVDSSGKVVTKPVTKRAIKEYLH